MGVLGEYRVAHRHRLPSLGHDAPERGYPLPDRNAVQPTLVRERLRVNAMTITLCACWRIAIARLQSVRNPQLLTSVKKPNEMSAVRYKVDRPPRALRGEATRKKHNK